MYSHEPEMSDIVHPFRPSGDFVIEAILEPGVAYFTGDFDQFESLDDELRIRVEKAGHEYYKEFKSPV